MPRAYVYRPANLPGISSNSREFELNDYSRGMNDYVGNDTVKVRESGNFWRYAQDARIVTLGEYQTRKGTDFHSNAAGETEDTTQVSTDGADELLFSETIHIAQQFTPSTSGRLSRLDLNLRNIDGVGTVLVRVFTDNSGEPGELLATSSIPTSAIGDSYEYRTARFIAAPAVSTGASYWIVLSTQPTGTGSFAWSTTTDSTDALTSTDSGNTWSIETVSCNFKTYISPSGGVKGLYRAYKSDGSAITLIAHDTTLYSVNDVTGELTAIKTGLSSSATHYRFVTVNDVVYYVNGFDGLRKWDFTTESQVNSTNYTHIAVHIGLLFLVRKDDPNRIDFSNFGEYEEFTSTDFVYADAPKTGDPITAILPMNGTLVIWTRYNKFILYGDDNATFTVQQAPGRKGTYSQETVAHDRNFAYFLAEDGIYRFNGTEDDLMSENIYERVRSLDNKRNSCLVVNKGRLYTYYTPAGQASNTECIVINLNFKGETDTVESIDLGTYVSRAVNCFNDQDRLLVGSTLVGQAYWQELENNDHTNLGDVLRFQLQTHFMNFGTSAREKEIRFWKPRFGSQTGNYTVLCQYATDLRNNTQDRIAQNVQGEGSIWGDPSTVWGSFIWGTTPELQPDLSIPGQYRRISIRYAHTGARQPHLFLGHTLVVQTRRLR